MVATSSKFSALLMALGGLLAAADRHTTGSLIWSRRAEVTDVRLSAVAALSLGRAG